MRAVARQAHDAVLVDMGNGMGRVLDLNEGRLTSPAILLQSILARGYWEPYTLGPEATAKLVRRVTAQGPQRVAI